MIVYVDGLNVKVWKSNNEYPVANDYPEKSLLEKKTKTLNTAIGFSGGGSRAFIAAMGYLAGLRDLDLLKNIRYIGGISGGAWAAITFTYVQNISNDEIFLCSIKSPENIKYNDLKIMDTDCVRSLSSPEVIPIAFNAWKNGIVETIAESWSYAISKTYLEPVGILPNIRFSWDETTVNEIKLRNKELNNEEFIIPKNKNRPFLIIGTALVGPSIGAPYTPDNRNYTMMEITPLYVGQLKNLDVTYNYSSFYNNNNNQDSNNNKDKDIIDGDIIKGIHVKHIGGIVEPYAFSRKGRSPLKGLSSDATTGVIHIPDPEIFLDLQFSAGTVSYAPGSLFESYPIIAEPLSMEFDYWSPSLQSPESIKMMYADGGSYSNIPLISFIQRRVSKVVLFFMSSVALKPFEDWDVENDPYSDNQITNDFSSFFGALSSTRLHKYEERSFEYEKNQIFLTSDYITVIKGLQLAQQNGKGIIATFNLTTIENQWWGISAGICTEITFSYLGRLSKWESLLNKEMHNLVVPEENSTDLSNVISHGPFKSFPHYFTEGGNINSEKANLLADLAGWSILQNEDEFRRMLS